LLDQEGGDMERIPELVPISEIRQRQNEILGRLAGGPVILTQFGRAAAVLISPEEYNRLVERLEELQDALDAADARREEGVINFDDYLAGRPDVPS
jgi:prevent-host-death family protein